MFKDRQQGEEQDWEQKGYRSGGKHENCDHRTKTINEKFLGKEKF